MYVSYISVHYSYPTDGKCLCSFDISIQFCAVACVGPQKAVTLFVAMDLDRSGVSY